MLHFASLRRVRPGLIVFAADVFGYLPCLGTGGVNAAGERRVSAPARQVALPTLVSLLRAGGCDTIDLYPCALVNTVNSSHINTPVVGELTDDVTPRRTD
jgi:hypothetical protein